MLDLTGKFSHLLIPQDMIESLLSFRELMTLEELKAKYMSPLHVKLSAEVVWPVKEFPPKINLVL